jgi:hypothetical protein
MGMLTDVFVAEPAAAATYASVAGAGFKRMQLARMTSLEFELLWAILEGKSWEPGTHTFENIADAESNWTFRFPSAAVDLLSALDAQAIVKVAKSWSECEELACEPSDLEPILRELRQLANAARSSKHGLFLWVSL